MVRFVVRFRVMIMFTVRLSVRVLGSLSWYYVVHSITPR